MKVKSVLFVVSLFWGLSGKAFSLSNNPNGISENMFVCSVSGHQQEQDDEDEYTEELIRRLEYNQTMLKQQYNQLLQQQKIADQNAIRAGAMAGRVYSNQSLQLAKQMTVIQARIKANDKELARLKGVDEDEEQIHQNSNKPAGSVKCSKCHGSGKCTHCAGRGEKRSEFMGKVTTYDCNWCKGTGRCEICNGRGKRFYNVGYR